MGSRDDLHRILLGFNNNKNIYYQPPATKKMEYPAISYDLNNIKAIHASNKKYLQFNEYVLTIMDVNPESELVKKVLELPHSSFDRKFKSNNLNHTVIKLYY